MTDTAYQNDTSLLQLTFAKADSRHQKKGGFSILNTK